MRVFFCDGLEVVEEKGAGVGRARPFVTVLENELSTLGDESVVSVRWGRTKARPEDWLGRCPGRHRRDDGESVTEDVRDE